MNTHTHTRTHAHARTHPHTHPPHTHTHTHTHIPTPTPTPPPPHTHTHRHTPVRTIRSLLPHCLVVMATNLSPDGTCCSMRCRYISRPTDSTHSPNWCPSFKWNADALKLRGNVTSVETHHCTGIHRRCVYNRINAHIPVQHAIRNLINCTYLHSAPTLTGIKCPLHGLYQYTTVVYI